MLSIDWRTPAAYDYAKSIAAAGFAWEYLRRNDEYQRDFHALAKMKSLSGRMLEAFSRRWGLRFSLRSGDTG
jgi:hypothetical protein